MSDGTIILLAKRFVGERTMRCGSLFDVGLPNDGVMSYAILAVFAGLAVNVTQASEVDFQRDIQPIFAEKCAACHGVDESTRQGGLRLDDRNNVLAGGDSGEPTVVPGDAVQSELVRRVLSEDPDEMMPPPDGHQRLTDSEVQRLKQWINDGAVYETHWSFVPPQKRLVLDPSANVVDAYVDEKLEGLGVQKSPAAAKGVLCRRLYLDLIGVPPSPEELQAFDREGFEATVDRLLSSERFGEKWARHWMDVARYSDTNGYEKDLQRSQWIWRDWVIRAFNHDLPYDQFVIEQIAGDLLENATQDQVVATGFLRNSMLNEEGAIIPEQFRMVEMFDRMDCVGKAFLGLSTQCAQCHSHKYDPLTMEEYYGMFSFLNNTYEAQSWVYSEEQAKQKEEVLARVDNEYAELLSRVPDWKGRLAGWGESIVSMDHDWVPLVFHDLNSVSGLNHPVQQPDQSVLMLGHTSSDVYMIAAPEMLGVTGLRLEALRHEDLPFGGPGRNSTGAWGIKTLELFLRQPNSEDWTPLQLVNATADFSEADQPRDKGNSADGPVAYLIDGKDETEWQADRGRGRKNVSSAAVVQFETPVDFVKGCELKVVMRMGDMLGCVRFSLTKADDPKSLSVDHEAVLALARPEPERTEDENRWVLRNWLKTLPEASEALKRIDAIWQDFPEAKTSVLHMRERPATQSRTTYQLERGAWDQPEKPATPMVPASLHPMPESDEPARLRFARWLADPASPLAARVAVNRIWQQLFGEGIVKTAEDFGTRAPLPEYPDLLDHLAVKFMEERWSQKGLIRHVVLSETYRQSSAIRDDLLELDPANRLLARGPRFRLDAEVVRDSALTAAGLIHHQFGGPSVIPPVPQNVLDYNYVYPSYWKAAEGEQRYRRGVYTFRKRSMPDPAMSSLDSPNGDFACARRVRSNTPLAALTCLNETVFVESARALAIRVLREAGASDEERIERVFEICLSREPTGSETQIVMDLLRSRRQKIAEGWLDARAITTGEPGQLPVLPEGASPQDAAAWTIAARVILNLDEFVNKN
jgi:mono/diheme cytochrome c family protein